MKSDNETIPGAVNRSPGICLTTEENPGKPQLGDCLMKVMLPVIAPNEVGRIRQEIRKGDGRD
jgi:hypothetical protein